MNSEATNRSQLLLSGAIIAFFAALAVGAAAFNGIPFGNDLTQHYQFAATIEEALSQGEMYPSLAPLSNNGTGDYGIRFYPPAGYYLLALCYKAVGGWFAGSILAFFLIFFAGGFGVYLWAREEFGTTQALIASALYVFAPYHLNQIYNSFLFGEFAASAVIPFCFLFVHRAIKIPSLGSAAALAAAYALLILTHLPSLIFCSIAFALYGLVMMYRSGRLLRPLAALGGAVVSSVAATSFYWIKLVTEMGWINHSKEEYFANIFGYYNHFLLRPSNILNYQTDSMTVWVGDVMLVAMLVACVPTLIVVTKRRFETPPAIAAAGAVVLLSIFMSSFLSKPVWDLLPFFQKIQFPWRWLGLVAVGGSLFSSYGIAKLAHKSKEAGGNIASAALVLAAIVYTVSAVFITKQPAFSPPGEFSDKNVRAMLTGESRDCWWTVWARDGFHDRGRKTVSASGRDAEVLRWGSLEREVKLGPGPETVVRFALQFYPHWRAYADGERVPVSRDESGLVTVKAPASASTVTLRFREPDAVRAAAVVSASAWALMAFALVLPFVRRTFRPGGDRKQEKPQLEA